jgi:hypothetical protein
MISVVKLFFKRGRNLSVFKYIVLLLYTRDFLLLLYWHIVRKEIRTITTHRDSTSSNKMPIRTCLAIYMKPLYFKRLEFYHVFVLIHFAKYCFSIFSIMDGRGKALFHGIVDIYDSKNLEHIII